MVFLDWELHFGCPILCPDLWVTASYREKSLLLSRVIVFLLQVNLEEMQTNKIKLHQILVAGGLSVLDGLCQRLADLSALRG